MRTRFLLQRDPQTHKCLQSWCVYLCTMHTSYMGFRCLWQVLFLASQSTQFLEHISAVTWGPACRICTSHFSSVAIIISHCSFLNLNSKWQGGEDLSGKVVCSSDIRASMCLSGGCSSFPVVFLCEVSVFLSKLQTLLKLSVTPPEESWIQGTSLPCLWPLGGGIYGTHLEWKWSSVSDK